MRILTKAWGVFTGTLVVLVVILAILLVGVRVVGLHPYTVLSGSMEPNYHVGSMIYVKSVPTNSLEVGDPVTFYLDSVTVATHRVIEVQEDPNDPNAKIYRTQGDANTAPDGAPLHSSKVIGKPIFTVPYLGYLSNFLQRQPGRSIALYSFAGLLLATVLPGIWLKKPEPTPSEPAESEADAQAEETTKG